MVNMNTLGLDEGLEVERHRREEEDAKRRAAQAGLPYLNLVSVRVPTELRALGLVSEERARAARVAPVQVVGNKLIVAVFNPHDTKAKDVLAELGRRFETHEVVASLSGLEHAWSHYGYVKEGRTAEISGSVVLDEKNLRMIKDSVKTLAGLAEVARSGMGGSTTEVLEVILGGAIALGASDVHIEAVLGGAVLRFRIDGILHTLPADIPTHLLQAITMRIKLLAGLRLNVKTEAQDGRFTIDLAEKDIEIRVSIIPSEYGESVVLRVLDPEMTRVSLEALGFRPDDLEIVRKVIKQPNGLILNTGPTGSGKTTTLYAFLRAVAKPEVKVVTIEDPIEYHLPGISQTQVGTSGRKQYTFASGLRSVLRQDPDVILVGEIRDTETASVAMNAALTGHLVFSTLHTNDAPGAVPRLYDLKIKPQIIGPALALVIAQRLIRRLCAECKKKRPLTADEKRLIKKALAGLPERAGGYEISNVFEPVGCEACGGFGYKGRVGIFELFAVDKILEALIYQNPTEMELKKLARSRGMVTIMEDGTLKALAGVTSLEEVWRAAGRPES